jgi:hypothetical protein
MVAAVKKYWETEYSRDITNEPPSKRVTLFESHLNRSPATPPTSSDFEKYITRIPTSLPDRSVMTLLKWWDNIGPASLRPMAFDFLSIPCTSCECERAFSSARRTVTFERMSLHDTTIEQVELLRNWWRQGLIQQSSSSSYDDNEDEDDLFDHLLDEAVISDGE